MRMLALAAVCGALFATTASAQSVFGPNQYVAVSGGVPGTADFSVDFANNAAREDVELSEGSGFQLAFGTSAGSWRLEGSVSHRDHDVSTQMTMPPGGPVVDTYATEAEIQALGLSAFYDLPTGAIVRPYVGAGLGGAQVDIPGRLEQEETTLHFHATAGLSVDVTPRVALFAEGRVDRFGDVEVDATLGGTTARETINFSSTGAYAGLRFGF